VNVEVGGGYDLDGRSQLGIKSASQALQFVFNLDEPPERCPPSPGRRSLVVKAVSTGLPAGSGLPTEPLSDVFVSPCSECIYETLLYVQDLFYAASPSQDHQSAAPSATFPLWLWCGVSRILRWEQSRLFGHLPGCAAANSLTRIILPVDVYVPGRWFIGNDDTTGSADVAYAYLNDPRCCRVFNENIRFRCLVRTKRGDLMASKDAIAEDLNAGDVERQIRRLDAPINYYVVRNGRIVGFCRHRGGLSSNEPSK
jgi:hypothetical protein